jgi:hypothetical protein
VRAVRKALGVRPTFKSVDTCAAEFEAFTPYYYKTYEDEDEVTVAEKPRAIILGARVPIESARESSSILLRARGVRAAR